MPCVASKFKPLPNEKIVLLGADYVVQQHPAASHLPFSAEGKRAIVYNLKAAAGNAWALKVFKKKYQTPDLLASVGNLKQLARFPGMLAANRSIIAPTDRPAVECPDLSYATLMPWIPGKTWNDLLLSAAKMGQQGKAVYDPQTGVALCRRFIEVMDELERIGAAHTDIAPGNVMLTLQSRDVQLLDLEDLFFPGAQPPSIQNTGSAGYRHPSADNGKTTWCPEGDRYAVAIMAAEFLIVSNPALGMLASDTGFFEGDRNSPIGAQRLALAYPFLDSTAPDFARLFKMAWNSSTLALCPRIADLRAALSNVSVPAITNQATPIPGVTWELPQARAQAAAAGASTVNTSQFWTQSGTQGQTAGPPAGIGWGSTGGITSATHSAGIRLRPLHWLLIVLALLIVGGILLYQHNAEVERRRSEYERQQLIEAETRRKAQEQEQVRLAEQARLKAEADAVSRGEAESTRYETWLRLELRPWRRTRSSSCSGTNVRIEQSIWLWII